MHPIEMEDMVRQICKNHNVECSTGIEHRRHIMRYNKPSKKIFLNPDRCVAMAIKMEMELKKFIEFATYHEIGHHYDFESDSQSKSVLERELSAWNLSRVLVTGDKLEDYDKFNEINLESYKKKLAIKK